MFPHVCRDIRRFQRPALEATGVLRLLWHNPGLKTLLVYRLGRWLADAGRHPARWPLWPLLAPLYLVLAAYYRTVYDIRLELSARIGPGLYIGHFGGIVVRRCEVGQNCAIQQEVRLEPEPGGERGPTVGDRVWVGALVRIEGALTVGERATIGAGAVVRQDVPAGALLLGNPARVVQREYDNTAFL